MKRIYLNFLYLSLTLLIQFCFQARGDELQEILYEVFHNDYCYSNVMDSEHFSTGNILKCSILCSQAKQCESLSFDKNQKMCYFYPNSFGTECHSKAGKVFARPVNLFTYDDFGENSDDKPAFFVYSETSHGSMTPGSKCNFEFMDFNNKNLYKISTKEAVVKEDGMYITGLNFAFNKFANEIILRNSTSKYDIKLTSYQSGNSYSLNSITSFDYFSAESIVFPEVYYIDAKPIGTMNSRILSWLMFKYDSPEYLSATTLGDDTNAGETVHYQDVREIKGIEIEDTRKFRIKKKGVYYINLGITAEGPKFKMLCFVNDMFIVQSGILRENNSNDDTISRAFSIYLYENDIFHCKVEFGILRGFAGSSLTMLRIKVGRRYPMISAATEISSQGSPASNPVPFSKVFVNEGNFWDSSLDTYMIKVPGIYFMYMGVGATDNKNVQFKLMINNQYSGGVLKNGRSAGKFDIFSRTILLKLQKGDELYFESESPYGFRSDFHSTSFTMFYVSTI
ncbi:DgyrCDS13748 [Dimorphilus gyrociliatus]|uniref:DgyrCDS13748 n=1 Tax=Dimorphilus gyrociliatus TaxID=2664684 RepID=A0A7I8WBM2_9ANNE|nr:DgyrCDS13748 [Dimorphilus gyrociliatus]